MFSTEEAIKDSQEKEPDSTDSDDSLADLPMWIDDAFDHPENPGGHQVVILIGIAAPVKTPLIGPPRQP